MRFSHAWLLAAATLLCLAAGPSSLRAITARLPEQDDTLRHSVSTLKVGDTIPFFRAIDQFGKSRDFENLKGPNGLVMLFFRSADWGDFGKAQLIQLQQAKKRFQQKGIGLVGISYDSQAILKYFSSRRGITFPLLADPNSKIIRRFGLLNPRGPEFRMTKGMAIPGFVWVGPKGRIKGTFFGNGDRMLYTANNVLGKLFPQLIVSDAREIPAPHLRVKVAQSDSDIVMGNRMTLSVTVFPAPGVRVFAHSAKGGYKPVVLKNVFMPGTLAWSDGTRYPRSKVMFLPAIHEKAPVFEGAFQITEDVTVASYNVGPPRRFAAPQPHLIRVVGTLFYQACNSKTCYPPASVPVSWSFVVMPPLETRAPPAIRHK